MAGQLSLLYLKSFVIGFWVLLQPANGAQWVQSVSYLLVLVKWFTQ